MKSRIWVVVLTTALGAIGPLSGANAANPSFDCTEVQEPDEIALCQNDDLARLDLILNFGFQYLKKDIGKQPAVRLARNFLAERKSCGADVVCIGQASVRGIRSYQVAGAPILVPSWAAQTYRVPPTAAPAASVDTARTTVTLNSTVPRQPAPAHVTAVTTTPAPIRSVEQVPPSRPATAPVSDASHEIRNNNGNVVFIWRDDDAQSEGIRLIRANADSSLIVPLLACIVNNGDRAIITDFGFLSSDITVISGDSSGCRGNIATNYIRSN